MNSFLQRHQGQILGVLSGFDRIRFRGSLLLLQSTASVCGWLKQIGVAFKDFAKYAEGQTKQLSRAVNQLAADAGRNVEYLNAVVNKEQLIENIRAEKGVARNGLIAVLSTLEVGTCYEVFRCRDKDHSWMRRRPRKYKHYYFYWDDKKFGLTQVRLSAWFPFDAYVVLNGREWLAKQMDAKHLGYLRQDNCFVHLADFTRAQKLADEQPRIDWVAQLNRLLRRVHPLHRRFFPNATGIDYYWTSDQTEWATDLSFRNSDQLAHLYRELVRHGIDTFHSSDVLRFLQGKTPAHGGLHGNFRGQVQSNLKRLPEGIRIKHRLGKNFLKMYNKQPTLLRVETTLNDGKGLKVYRSKQDDPQGKRQWRKLRKTVADLPRRAQLSQASNDRYLEALSTIPSDAPLSNLTNQLSQPVIVGKRRHRGLQPFEANDARLLQVVSDGQYLISGFRNRDLRLALFGDTADSTQRRREAGKVSRKLALLRAHGLIKKIPRTQRYELTKTGVSAIAVLQAAYNAKLSQFTAA
jgi:hypothetical protein